MKPEGPVKSGFYSIAASFAVVIISIAAMAILGRLLNPTQFGTYAIIVALNAFLLPLLEMGLRPAYIKLIKANQEAQSAFHSANIYLGFGILVLSLIATPVVYLVYREVVLVPLILVNALSLLLLSLSNIDLYIYSRENEYRKIFIIRVFSSVFSFIVSISFAMIGFGVWSLACKFLAEAFSKLVIVKILHPIRRVIVPIKELYAWKMNFQLGFQIMLSRFFSNLTDSFDKFIVGKIFSIDLLGQFERSTQLVSKADVIRNSIVNPILSHTSKLKDSKSNYREIIYITYFISAIAPLLMISIGDLLVILIIGEQWEVASQIIKFVAIIGVARAIKGAIFLIYINEMKGSLLLNLNIQSLIIFIPSILYLIFWKETFLAFIIVFIGAYLAFWFIHLIICSTLFIQSRRIQILLVFKDIVLGSIIFLSLGLGVRVMIENYTDSVILILVVVSLVTIILFTISQLILSPKMAQMGIKLVLNSIRSVKK